MNNGLLKRIVVNILVSCILLSNLAPITYAAQSSEAETVGQLSEEEPDFSLDERQKNSIAMLNYLTVLTQDINDAKNNRLYMEEVYNSLISNTYPNAVDQRTQSQLTSLLDTLEGYRMVDVKRERLEYIYEQNKAMAIKSAIPHPINVNAIASAVNPARLLAVCVFTGANMAASYADAKYEADMKYLQDGWELDDEQAATLHNSRKDAFLYMLDIVRENDLPGNLALSEENVQEFVNWKNNDNVKSRIKYMESNKETYRAFGDYWLVLIRSYYENGDFEKCADALSEYKKLNVSIFRLDRSLAQTLPYAITAIDSLYLDNKYNKNEYVRMQSDCLSMLVENTDYNDWSLRYFAAQEYCRLFDTTGNKQDLQKAYELVYDNVNSLVKKQRDENTEYLSALKEKKVPKGATKDTKKEISQYNKMLKAERKTALSPANEALRLNCELLFALAEELNISVSDKADIDGILHNRGEQLFLAKPLDDQFWFDQPGTDDGDYSAQYDSGKLELPVSLITDGSSIKVTVTDGSNSATYDDWILDEVKRDKSNTFEKFVATYTSKAAKKHNYTENSIVEAEIIPEEEIKAAPEKFTFKVAKKTKIAIYKDFKFEQVK